MNATVERVNGRYRAWCDECQDGLNSSSRFSAGEWVLHHERRRHNFRGMAA